MTTDTDSTTRTKLTKLADSIAIPTLLALLMGFMVWTRSQTWKRFVTDDQVYFSGNDAWYHYRQVQYTVQNWPHTMPFDAWTGYPTGTAVGQFGTLYDQLIATAAIIIGGGDPSTQTVGLTLLFAPPVFAALTVLPVYYIGKNLNNRLTGVFAAVLLAGSTGVFFSRGMVGAADHNVAEPFFMALGILTTIIAVQESHDADLIYEHILDRDIDVVQKPFTSAVLSGIALALYVFVWPSGVFLIGILAVAYTISAIVDHLQNTTAESLLLTATVQMLTAAAIIFAGMIYYRGGVHLDYSATKISMIQIGMPLGSALSSYTLLHVSRKLHDRDINTWSFPGVIATSAVTGLGLTAVVSPALYRTIISNILRVIGMGTNASTRTIGEAQPMFSRGSVSEVLFSMYGLLPILALVGIAILAYMVYTTRNHKYTIVGVWSGFIFASAITQIRFNYYAVIAVVLLAAYAIHFIIHVTDLTTVSTSQDITGVQILTVLLIVLLVTPGMILPATAIEQGQNNGVGSFQDWEEPLEWMSENTPDPADGNLEYYGTQHAQDGNYDYDEKAYGVMSWWDYGHWITTEAERIPVANPFQQHAQTAAQYLLADTEAEAQASVEELAGEDTNVKYVVVDWQMVEPQSKFLAPVVFNDNVSRQDMISQLYAPTKGGGLQHVMVTKDQRYYESLMVRLYHYHGSAKTPEPLVVNSKERIVQTRAGEKVTVNVMTQKRPVTKFETMQKARDYANKTGGQIGGVGIAPQEKVDALSHYRLVKVSENSALNTRYGRLMQKQAQMGIPIDQLFNTPQAVKIFERVEGAQITGNGPANTTVKASVKVAIPTTNSTFTYTQFTQTDANGDFTMTVPYSTTGYEANSDNPDRTNLSVHAQTDYTLTAHTENTTYTTTATVTEDAVLEGGTTNTVVLKPEEDS